MDNKIYNTVSKRFVEVNGNKYKQLIKSGYYVNNQRQLTPRTKIWVPMAAQLDQLDVPKSSTLFTSKVFISIVNELTPNDLIALYIANKEVIFTQDILNLLCHKYKVGPVKSFAAFIKLYNLSIKPYYLENKIEIPSKDFLSDFRKSKRNVNQRMRAMLYDWLIQINEELNTSDYVTGLSITLLDAYISKVDILSDDLQSVGVVCHYLACQVLEEIPPKIKSYIIATDDSTTKEKFLQIRTDIVNVLKGIIIRPSTVFFLDMKDVIIRSFALLSYLNATLMIYKPSLIAESIRYIVTKEYKIYSLGEISQVCRILIPLITQIEKSSFKYFKKIALILEDYKNYTCDDVTGNMPESPFKYNKEWHIGEYEKIETVGEGTYGKVVKIKRIQCNQNFVIKKSKQLFEPAVIELSVLTLLSQMKSEYVINLCGFQLKLPDRVDMYLPFMNSTLDNLVDTNQFNQDKFLIYAKQMIRGLDECHRCDVIHRDIKINNIVYHEQEDVFKLIDFGLSVPYASLRAYLDPDLASTFPYRAPEALFELQYNYKIDIWALGCVFYYIFTKKYIINEENWEMPSDSLNDIMKMFGTPTDKDWPGVESLIDENYLGDYVRKEDYLHDVFGQYYDFIMPCFILNPEDRINTKQLLS